MASAHLSVDFETWLCSNRIHFSVVGFLGHIRYNDQHVLTCLFPLFVMIGEGDVCVLFVFFVLLS